MKKRPAPELKREDFENALKDLDSYIDITLDDLMHITKMAQRHAWLRKVEELKVNDIMTTDVTTVTPDTTLQDAARTLLQLRISGLPVVDELNKLVGVVSEADFLSALGIPGHHPTHSIWQTLEALFKHPPEQENLPARVADIMSNQPIAIDADSTVHEVIDTMKQHKIKRVIVVDDQQHVQGIITRSNLVQVMLQQVL